MKPIIFAPNPILTTAAKRVVKFDKQLTQIVKAMRETLLSARNPKGVGLAAPQIGIPLQIFLTRPTASERIRVFINPKIVKGSNEQTDGVPGRSNKLEGCLSVPKIWGKVKRAASLSLRFQDEQGNLHEEKFKGFIATIIQHETDHVNGILYTQRVLEQKGKFYQTVKDKEGKDVLEELGL